MARGEISSAANVLERFGGHREGTPRSIQRALGYNDTWGSFLKGWSSVGTIEPVGANTWKIVLDGVTLDQESSDSETIKLDPFKFAEYAANFVLGDESQPNLTPFSGPHHEVHTVGAALTSVIDPEISTDFPTQTNYEIPLYVVERGLYYAAGDGEFRIFGAEILGHA